MTPPRELVVQWRIAEGNRQDYCTTDEYLFNKAARWGYEQRGAVNEAELQKARDEELEACCEQLRSLGPGQRTIDSLRALRRPKPKGQAEEALEALEAEDSRRLWSSKTEKRFDTIRAALERLRELEKQADD